MNRELGCPQRQERVEADGGLPGNVTALIKRLWRDGS